MSSTQNEILTPHGTVNYRVYKCDGCQKESLKSDGWIRIGDFFRQFEFVFNNGQMPEVFYSKSVCSTDCLKKIFPDYFAEFCNLYDRQNF